MCDLCNKINHNYIFLFKVFIYANKLNNINKFQIKINNLKNEMKNIQNNNELNLMIDNFEKLINISDILLIII